MAKSNEVRRIQLVVNPELFHVLGIDPNASGAPPVNEALARYASHLAAASARVARKIAPAEWRYLAEACNGTAWSTIDQTSAAALALIAEDAQELDGLAVKWLGDEDSAPRVAAALASRLARLTPIEADCVVTAIRWFWDHCDDVAITDPWWTTTCRARTGAGD